jgi:peptidoglycan/LPS O-acetylase OafA/YrhL
MNYKPRLDGLRFIAIMMVMLEHFVYFIGSKVTGGFYGVNLFFVLSGFLITSILLNESAGFKMAYYKFLGRRMLRIFPIYYLTLIVLFIINAKGLKHDLVFLLTYTYNYKLAISQNWHTSYSPFWSLAVEEQFYILFPFFILLTRKFQQVQLIILILLIFTGYAQNLFNIFNLSQFNYTGLLTNMSFLALGGIGALAVKTKHIPVSFFKNKLVESFMLLTLLFMLTSNWWSMKLIICPIINLYLIIKASEFSFKIKILEKLFTNKKIIYIGRISYGIYLFHLLVWYLFTTFLFDPLWSKIPFNSLGAFYKVQYNAWIIKFPLVTLLTVFLASLSYRYIESPILELKNKYFHNKQVVVGLAK